MCGLRLSLVNWSVDLRDRELGLVRQIGNSSSHTLLLTSNVELTMKQIISRIFNHYDYTKESFIICR